MANNLKTVSSITLATDVDQFRQALSGVADVGALTLASAQVIPAITMATASGSGNLNGNYYYRVILVTGWKQTDGSYYVNGFCPAPESAVVAITNGQGNVTLPIGGAGTIGRAVYRTAAGGATGSEKYTAILWNNTATSYLDNALDSALGVNMPNSGSTPAAYGTSIPANVPTTNTTGTKFNCPNYDSQFSNSSSDLDGYGINVVKYGIKNDNSTSIVSTFNSLISQGYKNFVFPEGSYKVDSMIDIPWGVNITCMPNASFKVYHTNNFAFRLNGRHKLSGLAFNYPNQDMTGANIIAYPAAIGCTNTIGYTTIQDVNLGNAYFGIDFSNGISGACLIYNVYGYPLYRGVKVDRCYDVLQIDRLHFNPNFFGTPNVVLKTWVWQNGIGVECGRYDFGNINRVFAYGYLAPFKVTDSTQSGSANNIKFTNWSADACQSFCIFAHHDGGLEFSGGTGTFFNPYVSEQQSAGIPIPSQSQSCGVIQGGGTGTWSSQVVHFKNNRIYRAESHGIWAYNPVVFIGNEVTGYANSFTETDTAVIDALQLNSGSDGSIVTGNKFDGKNKAQNRNIAIVASSSHKINDNTYKGWKAADLYMDTTGWNETDGHGIGTTAQRPSLGNKRNGYTYWDTTLGKMIYKLNSQWVDGSGNIV